MKKTLLSLAVLPLIAIGSLTCAEENEFIVHDEEAWTITVYAQDFSYWITIQDKNLWASVAWTWEESYWYYYQWWNNNWNPWDSEAVMQLVDWNDSYENHWYDWDVTEFIKILYSWNNINRNYDYWAETSWGYAVTVYANWTWNNLWWGGTDNKEQVNVVKWYDTVNHVATNVDNRQWPCGEWYHVPSAWERYELMMLWCNANSEICSWSVIKTLNGEEYVWANHLNSNGIWTEFSNDLYLPFAGYRYYSGNYPMSQERSAEYWSSSPRKGTYSSYVWRMSIYQNRVDPRSYNNRALGQSIRCFKNTYVTLTKTLTLNFISEGYQWTWEIAENMTWAIPEETNAITKTWYILEYRYLSWDTTMTKFDFENQAITWGMADEDGNVFFLAKWSPLEYTINYELYNWTNDVENLTEYTIESDEITLKEPTRDWYIFEWWFSDVDFKNEVTVIPNWSTWDITLYAKWKKKSGWWSGGWGRRISENDTEKDREWEHGSADDGTGDVIQSLDIGINSSDESSKDWTWNQLNFPDKSSEWQNNSQKLSWDSQELFSMHQRAYENWLTIYAPWDDAKFDKPLTRQQMAKISSIFWTKFLNQKADDSERKIIECSQYKDLSKSKWEMRWYVIQSCLLWNMWYAYDGVNLIKKFKPYDKLSVAQASVILSRMAWWDKYILDSKQRYQWHMYAVYDHELIDDISDPSRVITRWEAFTMMYRLSQLMEGEK